jgi:predicted permease
MLQDFRYGLRSFRKDWRLATVAIFALALGIGASTVVFSVFYNLLFNAFAAKNSSRLVVLMRSDLEPLSCSAADIEAIREQNQVFEDIVAYGRGISLVSDGRETYQLYSSQVDANAFDFYGVHALLGRGIIPEDGRLVAAPVFVLSYDAWRSDFNSNVGVLGRHFTVNGQERTLVGIMPPRFHAFGALQQMWIPSNAVGGYMLARLKLGVNVAAASADLDAIVQRLAKDHPDDFPKNLRVRVESATDFLLGPYGIGGAEGSEYGLKRLLYNLLVAAAILLLIACSNVANLLLAKATTREREIAVRLALGATRRQLVRQLLVESSVLATAACLVGCAFAYLGMIGAAAVIPHKGLGIGGEVVIGLSPGVLLFALGATALTIVGCGLVPALYAVPRDVNSGMARKGTNESPTAGSFRSALVIGEVALSLVLLVGTGLLIRSFYVLKNVDLGFDPNHLLIAVFGDRDDKRTPEQNKVLLDRILQKLKAMPGVSDAALNYTLPGYNGGGGSELSVSGSNWSEEGGIESCGASLFHTLGLRLLQGKWFSDDNGESAQRVAVINKTLARKFFGERDPIGSQLEVKPIHSGSGEKTESYEIVGVVSDVKNYDGPKRPVRPMAYIPYRSVEGFVILVRTNVKPRSMMRAIQQEIWSFDSSMIFEQFEPMEDTFDRLTYSAPKFGVAALAPLACIGLLLVVIGIFSVMAYTVSLRTHEIGVRMALGAQRANIMRLFLGKGAWLIARGIGIGLAASYLLTRFLESQIWGISAADPWTLGAVLGLIVLVGFTACLLPAYHATAVDPCEALRYE